MVPLRVRNSEVLATHEPPPSGRSRRQEAHFFCRAPGEDRPSSEDEEENEDEDDWFMAPMCVQTLEVGALHEPALTRPCGHPLPSDGRGAGGEGAFACRFMAPIRVHEQVETTHEPTLRELAALSLLTPHPPSPCGYGAGGPGPLPVEGRG